MTIQVMSKNGDILGESGADNNAGALAEVLAEAGYEVTVVNGEILHGEGCLLGSVADYLFSDLG